MYKMIVVDDERIVRDGLTSYFKDGKSGFTVIRSFGNGKETFEYIKEQKNEIDVVLTDITMPEMTGLELIKKIYEEKIDVETLLITGYKEFQYAQTAVKYGVYRYLLKPVKFHELDRVFMELKLKLEDKAKKMIFSESEEYKQFMVNCFLIELYSGFFYSEEIMTDRMQQLKIKKTFLKKPCIVADIFRDAEKVIENYKWKYDEERLDMAIFNAVRNENSEYYSLTSNKNYLKIIVIPKKDIPEENFFSEMYNCIVSGIENLKKIFSINMKVVEIEKYENLLKLFNRRTQSDEALQQILNDGEIDNSVISRALKYVSENYNKNIYISDVADYVGLNQVYFGRLFKVYVGENFTDYLIDLRIKKAMALLENENMKISEVSKSVGYDNIKYFSRIFKKRTGKTPIDYKKERM